MKGKKLLSDYMTDRKFPLNRKERQWLLWDGDRVAWVVGNVSTTVSGWTSIPGRY